MGESSITGERVIACLAERFPQLYIAPAEGEDTLQLHRLAAGRGAAPADANLSHFVTSERDELRVVDTPAGPIEVVFLAQRQDFETFLQIIGHKSQPVPIARTVGAITYRGLADWAAVARAHEEYVAQGGDDWPAEFTRLAKRPGAFRAELIVISEGPYSNIAASQTPYGEEEWLGISREIRLHHECAHVVCRRTMPDDILPVWDEITADVTGLLCATGHYDVELAARFLGVTSDGFEGGRLSEYLSEEQLSRINEVSAEVFATLTKIAQMVGAQEADAPFEFLLHLKRHPLLTY